MTHTYRISGSNLVGVVVFSAIWIGVLSIGAFQDPPASLAFLLVALLPLAYLFVYTQVALADDGTCEFHSPIRSRRIRAQRITKIQADDGAIDVYFDRGKIHMWMLNDLDELLSRLLELNPAIKLEGLDRPQHDATAQSQ